MILGQLRIWARQAKNAALFTIDFGVILSIIVATGVYALLLKFFQKNSPHNVQTKGGGGGQRLFEQC